MPIDLTLRAVQQKYLNMPVSFDDIIVGREYDRPELAKKWGYQSYQAIAKGVVTPRDTPYIILFITKEKQSFLTQYQDDFADGVLEIEGETSHMADNRIVNAESNDDEIHLFYRQRHHSLFVYQGQVFLTDYTLLAQSPSQFRFASSRDIGDIDSALEAEALAHGTYLEDLVPDPEGRNKIILSIQYERSRKNRRKAIEFHGNSCVVCGFDFDAFYGADFARGFIEVHHTKSVSEMSGTLLNVESDLVPVCSNCHSMLHRRRGAILSISELRERIEESS